MLLITFSKTGHNDIALTEDDLFDWDYEDSCFSSDTFELGGVNAKSLYLLIDNNDRRFSRGTFSNSRAILEIDGRVYGEFNVELPKRRDGIIEITAYNDMIKLDCEYPSDYVFPQVFWSVYAQCLFEAGLTEDLSFDNFELNALFDNGVISADYTDYIYANSCRQLISGMAEWNGGFVHINSDNKLQVDVFSKEISHEFYSSQLMELDYSDETVTFSKVKTSFKNKTYEKGDDSGYTLVIRNQYISYGLTDENFETYLTCIYDYYKGFTLTPMSLVLAEPDFDLKLGDRISVYDEEEDVTIVGNISKINITGNCTMTITCGGFGNVSSSSNFSPTSASQNSQTQTAAKVGVTAEKLQTTPSTVSVVTHNDGTDAVIVMVNDTPVAKLTATGTENAGFTIEEVNGSAHVAAGYNSSGNPWVNIQSDASNYVRNVGGAALMAQGSVQSESYGTQSSMIIVNPAQLVVRASNGSNQSFEFSQSCTGLTISCSRTLGDTTETASLNLTADGLWVNGKKVLTEE